jgi:hypothetical protein
MVLVTCGVTHALTIRVFDPLALEDRYLHSRANRVLICHVCTHSTSFSLLVNQ